MPDDILRSDRLESASYDEVFDYLRSINSETQRLEFKRDVQPLTVAKEAVAMANAIGGAIVCGFNDPEDNVPLTHSGILFATDEPAKRKLRNQILARAYPVITVDVFGYCSGAGEPIMLVRVDESPVAPHEYTEETGRFPVRRGNVVGALTLRELEAMLRRRDASGDANVIRAQNMLNFDFGMPGPDFIGIRLEPGRPKSHVLRLAEEREIVSMVDTLTYLNELTPETQADGVLFRSQETIQGIDDNPERRLRRCYVSSDGTIEMRFPVQPGTSLLYQLMVVLGDAYSLSSWLLRLLGQGPIVGGQLFFRYNTSTLHHGTFKLPATGTLALGIDFARTSFVEAFVERLLYLARWAGMPLDDADVRPALERFWRDGPGSRSAFAAPTWLS
jgi:hypothetical protein